MAAEGYTTPGHWPGGGGGSRMWAVNIERIIRLVVRQWSFLCTTFSTMFSPHTLVFTVYLPHKVLLQPCKDPNVSDN